MLYFKNSRYEALSTKNQRFSLILEVDGFCWGNRAIYQPKGLLKSWSIVVDSFLHRCEQHQWVMPYRPAIDQGYVSTSHTHHRGSLAFATLLNSFSPF